MKISNMRSSLLARVASATLAFGLASPAAFGGSVEYYHLDALGSGRVVTDASGAVIERHDYLPFGEECTTGPCAGNAQAGAGQPIKFTGKERDRESGFDYFGARYYGSKIARLTTTDPVYTWKENLADPQRWNRFAYVRNNPLKYVDPDGRVALPYAPAMATPGGISGVDASGQIIEIPDEMKIYTLAAVGAFGLAYATPEIAAGLTAVGAYLGFEAPAVAPQVRQAASATTQSLVPMRDAALATGTIRTIAGYDVGGNTGLAGSSYNFVSVRRRTFPEAATT